VRKKRILIIGILVAVVVAALYAFRGAGRDKENRILISGNIELTEVSIGFKSAGRLIERTVNEGDSVTKGQILARLDRDQLAAQRERESAGLASSQSQLAQAGTALEWQRATLAADIEQRRADLAAAEARLTELRNGARPQERQDAKARWPRSARPWRAAWRARWPRALGVVRVLDRRAVHREDRVADELVDRPAVRDDDVGHAPEVVVEDFHDAGGVAVLGEARVAAQVRHQHGDLALAAASASPPGDSRTARATSGET